MRLLGEIGLGEGMDRIFLILRPLIKLGCAWIVLGYKVTLRGKASFLIR